MLDRFGIAHGATSALAVALVLLAVAARAGDDGASDLVRRALDESAKKPMAASVLLSSTSGTRELEMLRKRTGDTDRIQIHVTAPFNYKDIRYLFIAPKGGVSDHYTYLPALRRTARITESALDQPFVATDFYVRDMIPPDPEAYAYRFTGDATVAGRACRLVESVRRSAPDSLYSKTILAIDPGDAVILRMEFFDGEGRPLKTWTAEKLEKLDDVWTPTEQTMKLATGGPEWRLTMRDVRYGVAIDDAEFTSAGIAR
jgi:hypothetical protein